MADEEAPKSYEQHLADLQAIAASGAANWALEREINKGRMIEPSGLRFEPSFLESHFGIIRNAPEND